MSNKVECWTCGYMTSYSKGDPNGHPHGFLQLSVRVPLSIAPKGYTYLGWYCSVGCLARKVLDLETDPLWERFESE